MSNLRLLIINKTDTSGLLDVPNQLRHLDVPNQLRHLDVPNQLKHLSWDSYPLKCLSSISQPTELVHLELRMSRLEYLWEGVMLSSKLKIIDLSLSFDLIRTPDFSGVPILEKLNLSWCVGLVEIHPSIGQLSKLRHLHLGFCSSLTDLPSMSAEMQSLTDLNLEECSRISLFPKFTGIMKSLSELKLGGAAIKKIPPSSIECLTALTLLSLRYCEDLECLPSNMLNLRSLEKLDLFYCSKLKSLPRLPSTVRVIDARQCYSLKWSLAQVKLSKWSQPFSQWYQLDERYILVEFKILFHLLQLQGLLCRKTVYGTSSKREEDGSRTEFQIISPSCLTLTERNSISIELPSNWYNSKWIGIAIVASLPNIVHWDDVIRVRVIALGDMPQNHWAFEHFTTFFFDRQLFTTLIDLRQNRCLLYLSRDEWFATVGNGKCSQIKVTFTIDVFSCGVTLLYEQDVDEFNQTNALCLIQRLGEKSIYKLSVGDDDDDEI